MNFQWEQYICLACKLIRSSESSLLYDASLRSAISRAYYGVYGVASTYLLDKGIPYFPTENPHQYVREKFKSSDDRRERQIGEQIGRLWRGRKSADYDDDFTVDLSNANKNLKLAITTVDELAKLKNKTIRH